MQANKYQEFTLTTAIYPDAGTGSDVELYYLTLGLTSEAGEVAGKIKKQIRDGELDIGATMSELSDCAWYIARLADAFGMTLEELFDLNYGKLTRRKNNGTLSGSGDHR